jgi:hypothetical protein
MGSQRPVTSINPACSRTLRTHLVLGDVELVRLLVVLHLQAGLYLPGGIQALLQGPHVVPQPLALHRAQVPLPLGLLQLAGQLLRQGLQRLHAAPVRALQRLPLLHSS